MVRKLMLLFAVAALASLVALAQSSGKPKPGKPVAKEPAKEAPKPAGTEPAHKAVGPEKCKMCHKIQYDSWAGSKHAAQKEKVECETCHGNGADYVTMAVMKDEAKAKAAGLLMPGKEFCTAKCHHAAQWKDDMCQKVHAHKPKPASPKADSPVKGK